MNANKKELLALGVIGKPSRFGERIAMLLDHRRAAGMSNAGAGVCAAVAVTVLFAAALAPRVIAQRMEFDVASVKPVQAAIGLPPGFAMLPRRSGDRISWVTNPQLAIRYAYGLDSFQLGPDKWINGFYDIEAKFQADATEDQVRLMFRALLEDRFKLKFHMETKQMPVYTLTVARGGPKLKQWTGDAKPVMVIGRPVIEGAVANYSSPEDPHHVAGRKTPASAIATYFASVLHSPVVDKTGLSGVYDFELTWNSEERALDAPDPAVVSDAMQRQLGLRLDSGKGPVDILMIERLEKPDEN